MAFIDLVRWDGAPDIFAWRFPATNLTTLTQLIVSESQEAVFFHRGKLLRRFGPGKHTLSTENIPLLHELYGIPFGGSNPFTAEVWFVNKATVLDVKWGTQQPFLVRDPEFGIMVPVRGYGQFGVRIEEAEPFLVKLVGTMPVFDREQITEYFRGLLLSRATSVIARTFSRNRVSVLDVAAHLAELSEALGEEMRSEFGEYGIGLTNFYISSVTVSDDDPAVVKLRDALSRKAEMDLLRYTYQQERSFDVLENAARNEGVSGGAMGAGMGVGMGFGVGGAVGDMMRGVTQHVAGAQQGAAPQPGVVPQPGMPQPGASQAGVVPQPGMPQPGASQAAAPAGAQLSGSCPACGASVAAGARFCAACGREVKTGPACCDRCKRPIPEGAKFCPFCGDTYRPCPACRADVPEGAAACPACGARMPQPCACGASVAADARFCPSCGKPVAAADAADAAARPAGAVCPSCGEAVGEGETFCAHCGTKRG